MGLNSQMLAAKYTAAPEKVIPELQGSMGIRRNIFSTKTLYLPLWRTDIL